VKTFNPTKFVGKSFAVFLLLTAFNPAWAQDIDMSGALSYRQTGDSINLRVERVENKRPLGSYSGTLVLQLWATATTYIGLPTSGHKMAEASLGQLLGKNYWTSLNKTVRYSKPPNGSRNVVLVLAEWKGSSYQPVDYHNFGFTTFGSASPPPAVPPRVDYVKPTLRVTTPGGNTAATVANQYTLRGTASDNVFPDRMQFSIRPPAGRNYGGWQTVPLGQGTKEVKSWAQNIILNRKGRWDVQIRVLDARGNASLVRTIMITRR